MKKTYAVATLISTIFFQVTPFHVKAQERNFSSIPLKTEVSHEKNYRKGEVIIKYKNAEKKEKALQKIRTSPFQKNIQKTEIKEEINNLNIAVIKSEKKTTEELMNEFKNDDDIEYVEPNYIKVPTFVPNEPPYYFDSQWALHNTGQSILVGDENYIGTTDADIDAVEAWDIEQNGATETVVAVIDSGIDYDFPELAPNMWDSSGGCFSDTGVSISCPNHGWDYIDNDNDPDDTAHPEFQWHGTHVASIFGAVTDNSTGIAGISRYNTIKMMALRFDLDTLTEIKAINFAKNNGVKVINASFAGTGYSQAEKNAIDAFPGIVVTASGNGGDDSIGDNNEITPQYPCNYLSNNIICVAASDNNDRLTDFSNYGKGVDIAAPGENILGIQQSHYYYGTGTSFATPLVAGTVALMRAHYPSIHSDSIKNILLDKSDRLSSSSVKIECDRKINVHKALDNVINGTLPIENGMTPIYRLYNTKTGVHLYTRGAADRDYVLNMWSEFDFTDCTQAFYASLSNDGNTPIYRLYNTKTGVHLYTRGAADRDYVLSKWPEFEFTDGVPAFYASLTNDGNTPIYRLYNTKTGVHLYTRGAADRDYVLSKWPEFEFTDGVPAFYAQTQ